MTKSIYYQLIVFLVIGAMTAMSCSKERRRSSGRECHYADIYGWPMI